MRENLPWLFGAFALGWALIFGYLLWLSNKEQALRKRLARVEALLGDADKG